MKKIYTLNSCSTCQKILKQLPIETCEVINIKDQNIDAETLDWIKDKVGSYEGIFSKKAMKYRSLGLHEMTLTENDYRNYILEEYTFLKRPYIINGNAVFIGNTKDVVAAAIQSFL
jgi:arsenate reductase (glutaredoxin)